MIKLRFNEKNMIVGIEAKDGEYIKLEKEVMTNNQVLEKWLVNLDNSIMNTVRKIALMAY